MIVLLIREDDDGTRTQATLQADEAIALDYLVSALHDGASCPATVRRACAALDALGLGGEDCDDETVRLCERLDWLMQVPS